MGRSLKERDTSLDLIRIVAVFLVISVHSLRNLGYYKLPMDGNRMLILTIFRQFFMCCVPLFMLLTGYLMNKKKLSKKYYKGITHTMVTYLVASCVIVLVQLFYGTEVYTFKTFILEILRFKAAPYAWYIEMYIGLFLLIPFLNLIYWNLESKKQKQWLIITLIIIVMLPEIFNVYNFTSENWWMKLFSSYGKQKLLPNFWVKCYPLVYYFVGCYLSEFKPKFKQSYLFSALFVNCVLYGAFVFHKCHGAKFVWSTVAGNGSLFNLITAVLVFLIIKNIDTSNWKLSTKKTLKYIASLSLATYLLSWIFDTFLVPFILPNITDKLDRLTLFPIFIVAVFVCSSVLSAVVNIVIDLITKLINKLTEKHSEEKEKIEITK